METHIRHLREAKAGESLVATTQILAADSKRLRVFHRLARSSDGAMVATAEQMLLHVDTATGRVTPAAGRVFAAATGLATAHADMPLPEGAGRAIGQS